MTRRQPEDGDLVTFASKPYTHWYEMGKGSEKPVLVVDDPHSKTNDLRYDFNANRWQRMVMEYMNRSNCWPDVWFQGSNGLWHQLSIKTGQYVKEGVTDSHIG